MDASYDWTRFGRHRLRAPTAVVIDCPVAFTQRTWMATIWADDRTSDGWRRAMWDPDDVLGRGWLIPERLALGDVIEVGCLSAAGDERWYGILDSYEVAGWLTLQGPYPHPGAAQHDADRLLAAERYLPPLPADARSTGPTRCSRLATRHHRHA